MTSEVILHKKNLRIQNVSNHISIHKIWFKMNVLESLDSNQINKLHIIVKIELYHN